MYRPTPERVIQPLKARQKFIEYWNHDGDAYAVKDRYTVPVGGMKAMKSDV
jgi:hypothetical protein